MEEFCGYPARWHHVTIAGRTLQLLMPVSADSLLDDAHVAARFAQDEYLPYWAALWPAAFILAEEVATWPPVGSSPHPPVILELGCGLGLVGLVALSRGYRVVLSDYDEDALAFARLSAARNGLPDPQPRFVDWRLTYDDLRPARIVAADVLYEARNLAPIAQFIRAHLARDGVALVSDAARSTAAGFPAVARQAGLQIRVVETTCVVPAGLPGLAGGLARGRLFELRHAADYNC